MFKSLLVAVLTLSLQIIPVPLPSSPLVVDLNKQYQIDNDMYFEGKLPPATVRYEKMKDLMGETTMGADRADIVIDTESNVAVSTVRLTLFHEECHVKEWPKSAFEDEHGPRWQGCMQRLAREGAFAKIW